MRHFFILTRKGLPIHSIYFLHVRRQKGADTLHVSRIPHRVYIQCTVSQISTELDSDKSTTFIRYLLSFCRTGYQKPWVTLGRENEGVLADTAYIFSVIAIHLHSILSLSLDIFDYHLNPLMKKTLQFMKCTKIDQIAIHLIIFVPGRSSTRAPAWILPGVLGPLSSWITGSTTG